MKPFKKTGQKSILEIMEEMYGKYKLSPKLDELKLVNSWEEIMGTLISKNTNKIYVNKNVLYLYVSNAPLKHELNFNKSQIIKMVNEKMGKNYINEVLIR